MYLECYKGTTIHNTSYSKALSLTHITYNRLVSSINFTHSKLTVYTVAMKTLHTMHDRGGLQCGLNFEADIYKFSMIYYSNNTYCQLKVYTSVVIMVQCIREYFH